MSVHKPRRPSGFTLIELMIVTAIIGVLASVAIPTFTRLTLRSRTSERRLMMSSIERGIVGMFLRDGKVEDASTPGELHGSDNPAQLPGSSKLRFENTLDVGWARLSQLVQFEGGVYYQYSFDALEAGANGAATLTITSVGDLDADTLTSELAITYERRSGQYWTDESDTTGTWCISNTAPACVVDAGTF